METTNIYVVLNKIEVPRRWTIVQGLHRIINLFNFENAKSASMYNKYSWDECIHIPTCENGELRYYKCSELEKEMNSSC